MSDVTCINHWLNGAQFTSVHVESKDVETLQYRQKLTVSGNYKVGPAQWGWLDWGVLGYKESANKNGDRKTDVTTGLYRYNCSTDKITMMYEESFELILCHATSRHQSCS